MAKRSTAKLGSLLTLSGLLSILLTPCYAETTVPEAASSQASSQPSSSPAVNYSGTNVIDFANHPGGELVLTGDLINSGVLYAISTNPTVTSAVFTAPNIFNQTGASISSVLPTGGLPGYANAISGLNLVFNASNNFVNQGLISSAGSLSITAGGSITNALPQAGGAPLPVMQALNNIDLVSQIGNIVNAGTITAATGNININAASVNALAINGIGGVMQALQGSINIRDTLYNNTAALNMLGGDWLSENLNLLNGKGAISAQLNSVSGTLNAIGNGAQIGVGSGDLILGDIKADGDPIYYSADGDVFLPAVINTLGEDLAVIARGNVAGAGTTINTSGATKSGNVLIVAGASFVSPTSGFALPAAAGFSVTFTSPDPLVDTGGRINPVFLNITTGGASHDAGNVTLIAYEGTASSSGQIVPVDITQSNIDAKANSGFGGGSVTLIAGASSDQAINWGNITGGGGAAAINIFGATPQINGSGEITVIDGTPQAGSGTYIPGAQTQGNIELVNLVNDGNSGTIFNLLDGDPGGAVIVQTGGDLTISYLSSQGGQGAEDITGLFSGKAGGAGGSVNLSASVIDLGLLAINGGRGGDGGHNGFGILSTQGGRGGNAGSLIANASTSITAGSMEGYGGDGGAPAAIIPDFTILGNNATGGNGGLVQITAPDILVGTSNNLRLHGGNGGDGIETRTFGGNGFGGGNGGSFIANASNTFEMQFDLQANGGNAGFGGSSISGGTPVNVGGSSVGPGGNGGSVQINAGDITLSDIDISGGLGGSGGDGALAGGASAGGKGGSLSLNGVNSLLTDNIASTGGAGGDNSSLTGLVSNGGGGGLGGTITLSGTACCVGDLNVSGGNGGDGGPNASLGGNAGGGGIISIQSVLDVVTGNVFADSGMPGTGSALNGNGANGGSISMTADTLDIFLSGDVSARGFGVTGAAPNTGGSITLSSPSLGIASFGAIQAKGEGGANGGTISLNAPAVALLGANIAANSLDVTSDAASGGTINLITLGPDPLTNSACGCNIISGNVDASGAVNGGRINLGATGGFAFDSGLEIRANGGSGTGGLIQFTSPGNSVINMSNDALVTATNTAGDSGRIGFNAGPAGFVNISGSGTLTAGDYVGIGNLNPLTLDVINPLEITLLQLQPPGINGYQMVQGTVTNRIFISQRIALPPSATSAASTATVSATNVVFVDPNVPSNTTISNIDQTPFIVSIRDKRILNAESGSAFLNGVLVQQNADALGATGLNILQGNNGMLVLNKGNLLILPHGDQDSGFEVQTQEGILTVAPGSIAFLIETGNDVAVYALHERQRGDIRFRSGSQTVEIATGQQAVFTRSKEPFEKINPGALIPARKINSYQMDNGVTAHISDYSIPMALSIIHPLKKLRGSGDPRLRKVSSTVQKNAAIMSMLGVRFGPYKTSAQP